MIVMMIAITPSLNASIRPLPTREFSNETRRQFDDPINRLVNVRFDGLRIGPVIGNCLVDIGHRFAWISAGFGEQRYVRAAEQIGEIMLILLAHRNANRRLIQYRVGQRAPPVLLYIESTRQQIARHHWTDDMRKVLGSR